MKPDLLIEVDIGGRAFAGPRISSVVETGTVGVPGDAAARRPSVDAWNHVWQCSAGCGLIHMNIARFTAPLGKRYGDVLAVPRRDIEVYCGSPRSVQLDRIENHARGVGVIRRFEYDQERLFFRRLGAKRKQHAATEAKRSKVRGRLRKQGLDLFVEGRPPGYGTQVIARVCVLSFAPRLGFPS